MIKNNFDEKKRIYDNYAEWLIDNDVRYQLEDIPQYKAAIIWDNAIRNYKLKQAHNEQIKQTSAAGRP